MTILKFPLRVKNNSIVNRAVRAVALPKHLLIHLYSEPTTPIFYFRFVANENNVPTELNFKLNTKLDGSGVMVPATITPLNTLKPGPLYVSDFCDYRVSITTPNLLLTKNITLYLLPYSSNTKLSVSLKLAYSSKTNAISISKPFSVLSFQITTNTTPETITLPLPSSSIAYIDWNEQAMTKGDDNSNKVSHTYTKPGNYTITITYKPKTPFSLVYDSKTKYYNNPPQTDARCYMKEIYECINVTNMRAMFATAYLFTGSNIGTTERVTDMSYMFYNNLAFNGVLNLDTRSVTNMAFMFNGAANCKNITINDTSKVTDMCFMFSSVNDFAQDISKWNTSKVTNMFCMFLATGFTTDMSGWDVSKVTNMGSMFENSTSDFTKFKITGWNTTSLKNVSYMFSGSTLFDKDISTLNVAKVTSLTNMLKGSGMSKTSNTNYSNFDTKSKALKQLLFG